MGIKVLAEGHTRFTLLTTKPALWDTTGVASTTELTAGIDALDRILKNGFQFGPITSDTIDEGGLYSASNAKAWDKDNGQCEFLFWRKYLAAGGIDSADDLVMAALKIPGTTVWAYARQTDKKATSPWVAAEEIMYAAEMSVGRLLPAEPGGYIKYKAEFQVVKDYQWLAVGA